MCSIPWLVHRRFHPVLQHYEACISSSHGIINRTFKHPRPRTIQSEEESICAVMDSGITFNSWSDDFLSISPPFSLIDLVTPTQDGRLLLPWGFLGRSTANCLERNAGKCESIAGESLGTVRIARNSSRV